MPLGEDRTQGQDRNRAYKIDELYQVAFDTEGPGTARGIFGLTELAGLPGPLEIPLKWC